MHRPPRFAAYTAVLILLAPLLLGACTTVIARAPVPGDQIDAARPYGIDGPIYRVWGDRISQGDLDEIIAQRASVLRNTHPESIARGEAIDQTILALSGGGPDGAYGAGILKAWTERGDRPVFDVVTGISTGSIIALFAFLGPDYDAVLEEIYTTYTTDQLLQPTVFTGLTGGSALTDATGYRALIERYVDDAVVDALAAASAEGRTLLIGTTNMDASRPVVWSASGIAATGHPMAKTLIHDIIQASSAIPAAFPPVLIPVATPEGETYDEMHVDGGASQQVMFFSPQLPMRLIDERLGLEVERRMYIVINNKLVKTYDPVSPRVMDIAGRAVSSLISGSGTGDVYKIFAIAERDDIDLSITWIPDSFDVEAEEAFDPVYMRALFELGYKRGREADLWAADPPDFVR